LRGNTSIEEFLNSIMFVAKIKMEFNSWAPIKEEAYEAMLPVAYKL